MSAHTLGRGVHLSKGIVVALFILVAAMITAALSSDTMGLSLVSNFFFKKTIYIDNETFHVWVARTASEREASLNNKNGMPENTGMVFVFDTDGTYEVSTAKMHFPVDVLWLNREGSVVSLEREVPPGRELSVRPPLPARYVLLLNAGIADKYYIDTESHVNISNVR
ncbi:MAG: DUF192 domain-containing protein [bacterium]|nr:DUF192 domain-containing protein [bacterium]